MIFRFNGISGNTDFDKLFRMTDFLKSKFKCEIWYCISIFYYDSIEETVYPNNFQHLADHKIFLEPTDVYIPNKRSDVRFVSHGLYYVDHRLLSYDAQELSILTASKILQTPVFVPPYHKWNGVTQEICAKNSIFLVRYEDGWKEAEKKPFTNGNTNWFISSQCWKLNAFKEWIENGLLNT